MATVECTSPAEPVPTAIDSPRCQEVVKEHSLDSLMDKLRSKSAHYKPWGEISKALRMAVMERRTIIDGVERAHLQKVLDTLQKSIKVTSLQSMVERLDSITRQQGLKFNFRPSDTACYISSDMFYVEILLEQNGEVKDVKIAHNNCEPLPCQKLTPVLRSGNFAEFTKHLEGLAALYQLNASKTEKSKAFMALQALETDLSMLAQLQSSSINVPTNLVHKSPVGILQQRQGGFSLKMTYFISPYDLLDLESKTSIPLTVDAVTEKGLGHSVTVCIESSPSHKLQTVPLISISKRPEGKSLPQFAALSFLNSATLPASFVLKLPEPIPMATSILKKIQGVTKMCDSVHMSNCQPLLSVIINDTSKGKLSASGQRDIYVTLPDQHHCYNMKSNHDMQGVLVSAIPFTIPTHVPQILVFLRQQMLFNTIISSCVRPESNKDPESAMKFDVHAYSTDHIQVTFVHPLDESLAAVDLDLKEITNVKCKIHTLGSSDTLCSDEYASKIMQRCWSIPVTMRAVIRKAHGQQQQMKSSNHSDMYCATVNGGSNVSYLSHLPNYSSSLTNGSSFSGGDFSNLASRMCNKPLDSADANMGSKNIKSENQNYPAHKQLSQNPESTGSDSRYANSEQLLTPSPSMQGQTSENYADRNVPTSKNPLLGTLLSQGGNSNIQAQYQQSKPANTMLMSMLSDVPSATPSTRHFSILGQNTTTDSSGKIRKQRKRKATSDARSPGSMGRSPKRKLSGDESTKDHQTLDPDIMDSSAVGFDVSLPPSSVASNVSDSTHMGRSITSLEIFVKTEPQTHGYPQRSASTDSYLMHNFQAQQVLNINESSRLSEGGTPNNPDSFCPSPQIKSEYFGADNSANFHQGHHSRSESKYVGNPGDVDVDDDNSFSLDEQQSVTSSQKLQSVEKSMKKIKKSKDSLESKSENKSASVYKTHEVNSSEDSNQGDFLSKLSSDVDNPQSEDVPKAHAGHTSEPIIISTSLKIAKSGDGHKVSKTELKVKQKEGRRSTSAGDGIDGSSGRKRSEAKKERKRRRAESADSISGRSPVRSLHLNVDSSLMPPPASPSSESSPSVTSEQQPLRTITLNMKASPTSSSSSSPSRSKSPSAVKKSGSGSSTSMSSPSKSSSLKSGSDRIGVKPSPPRSSSGKSSNVDPDNSSIGKITLATSLKNPSKHKQSSNVKSGSGSVSHSLSHVSGRSSPSKNKPATLKLKNVNASHLPSSTSLSPIAAKVGCLQASPDHLSQMNMAVSVVTAIKGDPPSPQNKHGSNDPKANKSLLRPRKSSLSAVIDKLKMTATTNAQHVFPIGSELLKCEDGNPRNELTSERKESKFERKEGSKDLKDNSLMSKNNEAKTKYFSSDQFTVKQSSQGIKLTVTKTRASDGSSKSKSKASSKTAVSGSGTSSSNKLVSSSAINAPKSSNTSISKRTIAVTGLSHTSHSSSLSKTSHSNNQTKSISTTQKNFSSVGQISSSKMSSSSNSSSKSSSKTSSVAPQVKSSSIKPIEKPEKKSSASSDIKSSVSSEPVSSVSKEKIHTTALNLALNLMPPPPSTKTSEITRPVTLPNTVKRSEDSSVRHSPRRTPTRDSLIDDMDGEQAFRLLLAQSKAEGQNGAEETVAMGKPLDFVPVPVNFSKTDVSLKNDLEEKNQWVSSSTDIKTPATWSLNANKINPDHGGSFDECLTEVIDLKQAEVSSSNRLDSTVNVNLIGSSEDKSKIVHSFTRPIQQTKRIETNAHSEVDSSPEDGWVIDCPDTPRLPKASDKKWTNQRVESNYSCGFIEDKADKLESSPGVFTKSPYPPLKSPAQVAISPSNHSSDPSPFSIDDDLMNEAVGPLI